MSKRPREEQEDTIKKSTPLSREDAERLVAYLTKHVQSNEENTEDYHHKKQKNKKNTNHGWFTFNPFNFASEDSDDDSDYRKQIIDVLSDIAIDKVTEEEITTKFSELDNDTHTLSKWSYEIPYPKELDKIQISHLSRIPTIVKIQIEQSNEDKCFRLCVFSTTDPKIANKYRAEDLRIESERRSSTLFNADTFIAWIGKYFPNARYDPKIGTKLSYSKIGKHMLKTYCVFIKLPVTASQIISFMSPIWIHDVKIMASNETKAEILMAITSFADQ